jgi:hypothetical protein
MRTIADYTIGLVIVMAHLLTVAWQERNLHLDSSLPSR